MGRLLLLIVVTAIVLALSEAGLRLSGRKSTGLLFTADPLLGWSLRPGAGAWETGEGVAWSRINRHGYRDRERNVTKSPGTYRVAVLGDSLTEARQVAMGETFTSVAESELKRRSCLPAHDVEVLNFGVAGFGTAQELLLLQERVWPFDPDMVVLQVYTGNDIFNNHRALNVSASDKAPYFVLKNGQLELDSSFRQGLANNQSFNALKAAGAEIVNRFVLLQMVYEVRLVAAQQADVARLARQAETNALPPEYQRFLAFLPPTLPAMVEAWRVTEALLSEFYDAVRSHHVPLLLLIVPTSHQIHYDPSERQAYRAKYNIDSLEYADERVEHHAQVRGIPADRLSNALLLEASRTRTFMVGFANTAPNEGHLNARGHVVIARELVNAVCALAATPVMTFSQR
jgi:lysophospholipase L1-like esterase